MLRAAGARVRSEPGGVEVWPAARLEPLRLDVPGDFSAAAPFVVAATLLPGSRLRLPGVGVNPTRTGLLDVLERMGARISLYNRSSSGGEPVADVEVEHADLVATEVEPDEVPPLIDELPLFALAASMARGRERRARGGGAAAEGDGPDRDGDGCPPATGGPDHAPRADGFTVRGVPTRPTRWWHGRRRRPPDRDPRGGRRARLARGRAGRGRGGRVDILPRILRPARVGIPDDDRLHRRPRGGREEHRGARTRAAPRLPLPRHRRDVPGADVAGAAGRGRRSTRAQQLGELAPATRSTSTRKDGASSPAPT